MPATKQIRIVLDGMIIENHLSGCFFVASLNGTSQSIIGE